MDARSPVSVHVLKWSPGFIVRQKGPPFLLDIGPWPKEIHDCASVGTVAVNSGRIALSAILAVCLPQIESYTCLIQDHRGRNRKVNFPLPLRMYSLSTLSTKGGKSRGNSNEFFRTQFELISYIPLCTKNDWCIKNMT